ncbi:MAG: hypothetical protein MJ082_02160 [Clostridia bacterium]|nr:hypothetical protein [Clostridia bacterium]
MSKAVSVILRILAFLLVFILGFLTCVGAIAGAGFYAYKKVSYSQLQEWGVPLPETDALIDEEGASVSLTSMTAEQLVKEIKKIRAMDADSISLDFLLDRYGVTVPESVTKFVPDVLRTTALKKLASQDGMKYVMDNVTLDFVFGLIPEFLSAPAREALADISVSGVMSADLTLILGNMKLGYLVGVSYNKVGDEWQIAYADSENPTAMELLAPLNIGNLVDAILHGGDLLGSVRTDLGTVKIEDFLKNADSRVQAVIADKTIGDVITLNSETGKYTLGVKQLLDGLLLGSILGYEQTDGVWYDASLPLTGIDKALAGINIGKLVDTTSGYDIADAFQDTYLGDVMGFAKHYPDPADTENYVWMNGSDEVSGIQSTVADYNLYDLIKGNITLDVEGMQIDSLLGIYPKEYLVTKEGVLLKNPADLTENFKATLYFSDEACTTPAADMLGAIASMSVDQLASGLDSIKIGSVIGCILYDGDWYDYSHTVYSGEDALALTPASGILACLADLSIADLTDSSAVTAKIQNVKLGEALGYTKVYDPLDPSVYNWYDGTEPAAGILGALADSKISEIETSINTLSVGKVLGYEKRGDGKWYENASATEPVTGVLAAIIDCQVQNLQTRITALKVGEVIGWTFEGGVWMDGTVPATGIMTALADLTVNELSDSAKVSACIRTVKVGEAMGFVKRGDGKWYENSTAVDPVSGVLGAIADSDIGNIETDVNGTKVGVILGYYTEDDTTWYTDSTKSEELSPLLNKISASQLSNIGSVMDNLVLSDIFTPAELSSGFLSLLFVTQKDSGGSTVLVGGKPVKEKTSGNVPLSRVAEAMQDTMQYATVGEMIEKGVVSIDDAAQSKLDAADVLAYAMAVPPMTDPKTDERSWRFKSISDFINDLINMIP